MKHFLHHLFIPRESNNHRPRILHYEIIVLIIGILVSGLITIAGAQKEYPAVLGISSNISVSDLLRNTNLKRQQNGLAPLTLNQELSSAAANKAKDMLVHNYWAHISPDGTTPWVFIKDSGYQYLYAGENLARGYTTGEDVVNAWMASPTHKDNLLSPNYTDIGFAIDTGSLTGSETVLVVQMFGSQYIPKDGSEKEEPVVVGSALPTGLPAPTASPTQPVVVAAQTEPQQFAGVAAIQNKPLFDTSTLKRNTSFIILLLFIAVLLVDAIIIERKKIARVFSHNIDHALFLLFILLAGILIGRGVVL